MLKPVVCQRSLKRRVLLKRRPRRSSAKAVLCSAAVSAYDMWWRVERTKRAGQIEPSGRIDLVRAALHAPNEQLLIRGDPKP